MWESIAGAIRYSHPVVSTMRGRAPPSPPQFRRLWYPGLYLSGGWGLNPPRKFLTPPLLLKKLLKRLSMYLCISTVVDFNSQNFNPPNEIWQIQPCWCLSICLPSAAGPFQWNSRQATGTVCRTMRSLPRLCRPSVSVWKHFCSRPRSLTLSSIPVKLSPLLYVVKWQLTICFKLSKPIQIGLCMLMSLSIHLHDLVITTLS